VDGSNINNDGMVENDVFEAGQLILMFMVFMIAYSTSIMTFFAELAISPSILCVTDNLGLRLCDK
jgi:hypothetical protein